MPVLHGREVSCGPLRHDVTVVPRCDVPLRRPAPEATHIEFYVGDQATQDLHHDVTTEGGPSQPDTPANPEDYYERPEVLAETEKIKEKGSSPAELLEKKHVYDIYDATAHRFANKYYRPWPRVLQFLQELEPGSVVVDVGCGNGRYLQVQPGLVVMGAERCQDLAGIAAGRGSQVVVCCNLHLPYCSQSCDAVLSVAVIHHFSSRLRRVRALREMARILRPGGRLLVYVGAMEHKLKCRSGPDVLVPWHLPNTKTKAPEKQCRSETRLNTLQREHLLEPKINRPSVSSSVLDSDASRRSHDVIDQPVSGHSTPLITYNGHFLPHKPPSGRRHRSGRLTPTRAISDNLPHQSSSDKLHVTRRSWGVFPDRGGPDSSGKNLRTPPMTSQRQFEKTQSEEITYSLTTRMRERLSKLFRKTKSADEAGDVTHNSEPSIGTLRLHPPAPPGTPDVTSRLQKDMAYMQLINRLMLEEQHRPALQHASSLPVGQFAVREFPGSSVTKAAQGVSLDTGMREEEAESMDANNVGNRNLQLEVVRDVLKELENKTGTEDEFLEACKTVSLGRNVCCNFTDTGSSSEGSVETPPELGWEPVPPTLTNGVRTNLCSDHGGHNGHTNGHMDVPTVRNTEIFSGDGPAKSGKISQKEPSLRPELVTFDTGMDGPVRTKSDSCLLQKDYTSGSERHGRNGLKPASPPLSGLSKVETSQKSKETGNGISLQMRDVESSANKDRTSTCVGLGDDSRKRLPRSPSPSHGRRLVKQQSLMVESNPSSPAQQSSLDTPDHTTQHTSFSFPDVTINVTADVTTVSASELDGESDREDTSQHRRERHKRFYHLFKKGELEDLIRKSRYGHSNRSTKST